MNLTRRVIFSGAFFAVLIACIAWTSEASGQTTGQRSRSTSKSSKSDSQAASTKPKDYRSQHFYIHTDLSPTEAKELLDRLEAMLKLMSKYWGRPPSGIIECYVVSDKTKWEGIAIDPAGWASIEGGGGVTLSQKLSRGEQFVAKSTVYANSEHGTPQHEAVHAFCYQTFGRTGPTWYSEGMAEIGNYWRNGEKFVNVPKEVAAYLRSSTPKSLAEIVDPNQYTGDSWQNYAWRWALCHLLDFSPNYSARFRELGLGLLHGKDVSFEKSFGAVAREIDFEYQFFLKHFDNGYRVDLCSWDWKSKFVPLVGSRPTTIKVAAAKGWQASHALVNAGEEYQYKTIGTWSLSKEATPVNADGDSGGAGRLVGIVMHDYTLGEPFELGADGSFTAPASGKLFLRCKDAWNELADNKGSLTVRLKAK